MKLSSRRTLALTLLACAPGAGLALTTQLPRPREEAPGGRQPLVAGPATQLQGLPAGALVLWRKPILPPGFTDTGWTVKTDQTESWVNRPTMAEAHHGGSSGVIGDRLYVAGGQDLSLNSTRLETWSPAGGGWSSRAPLPTPQAHAGHGVIDEKLHVASGWDGTGWVTTHRSYDPLTDMWTDLAPVPTVQAWPGCGVVNGKLYLLGGSDGVTETDVIREYDPDTDMWSTRTTTLPTARTIGASCVLGSRIYLFGGNAGASLLDETWIYDPLSDQLVPAALVPAAFEKGSAAVLDKRIHVFGGEAAVVMHGVYDPAVNTWNFALRWPSGLRVGSGAQVVGGQVHLFGGFTGATYTNVVQAYIAEGPKLRVIKR